MNADAPIHNVRIDLLVGKGLLQPQMNADAPIRTVRLDLPVQKIDLSRWAARNEAQAREKENLLSERSEFQIFSRDGA